MSRYSAIDREAEFEAYDALPAYVKKAFQEAHANWSAKECMDYWRDPLNLAFCLPDGKAVFQQIVDDVKAADEQERQRDRAVARMLAAR